MKIIIGRGGCNTANPYEYMDTNNPLVIGGHPVDEKAESDLFLYLHAKRHSQGLTPIEETAYVVCGKRQCRRLLGIRDL